MHWADGFVNKIIGIMGQKDTYVVASGITPSGTIHLGNFREVITVDLIARALKKNGKKVRFIYSWDNYDVFRKVPVNLPNQDILKNYLRMPITDVPDTTGKYDSFAQKNEKDFEEQVSRVGINPEYIYQEQKYRNCDYTEGMKQALLNKDKIIEVLNEYRKEPLSDSWFPVRVFCDSCKKDTTVVTDYDGDLSLTYECECGHKETFDFSKKGIAKLVWRVDWPMRWDYEKVDFESGGKDHYAAGGSRETGEKIYSEIWNGKLTGFMYDWISVKGGLEFSSSKGIVVTLNDALEVYEPEIIRYLFAGTKPGSPFAVSFDLDVLKIYEDFDKCERIYYKAEETNDKNFEQQKRIYELSALDEDKISSELPIQPKIRHLTNLLQIHEMNEGKVYELYAAEVKNEFDKNRLKTRINCAKNWILKYAPEDFKFSINDELNSKLNISDEMKEIITLVRDSLTDDIDSKELHEKFYAFCNEKEISIKDFFTTMYLILIGKQKGPMLANFILTIGVDRVRKILSLYC